MKIGFFTDAYFPQINGLATSIDETARALRKEGHEVFIITSRYPSYKDDDKNVIRLASIPFQSKINVRLATHLPEKTLFKLYRTKFDLIHGHGGGTISLLGLEIARLQKIPYIFTYHTLLSHYTHYFLKGLVVKPKTVEMASRVFCNRCTAVIAPSKKIKDELSSYGVTRPISIVPTGLDPARFKNAKGGFLRAKLGIKDERKILLTVGRLGKEKSIDFIIQSFAEVCKKDQNSTLVVVGEGPERKKLQDLAKSLGLENRVFFTGNIAQADMPSVYKDAEVFLFASESETQGLVILESVMSGVPVVAVKDDAVEDIIKNNFNGIITDRNIYKFASGISKILEDNVFRKKLSENSVKNLDKLSIQEIAKDLSKLYSSYAKYSPRPFISVVIPAYNEEKYLPRCLRALSDQNYPKDLFDVTVVNNNSTDKTAEIAEKFNCRVILEKTQGYVFALKRGMNEAKGGVVAVTDADTQVDQNWLSVIEKSFENPKTVAITGMINVTTKSNLVNISAKLIYRMFMYLSTFIGKPNLTGFNFAVRKDALSKVGGLDTQFTMSPDVDLGIKLKSQGKVSVVGDMYVTTSIRRWQDEFVPTFIDYAKGYVYAAWLRKPPVVKQTPVR